MARDSSGRFIQVRLQEQYYQNLEGSNNITSPVSTRLGEQIRWHDGRIDGGDLNGVSPAMDYLDLTNLDGGAE